MIFRKGVKFLNENGLWAVLVAGRECQGFQGKMGMHVDGERG